MSSSTSTNIFSPITLFESTLTNATMLAESMNHSELLSAHQISTRLLTVIVEALHKLSENLVREVQCHRVAAELAQAHLADVQSKALKTRIKSSVSQHNIDGDHQSLSNNEVMSTNSRFDKNQSRKSLTQTAHQDTLCTSPGFTIKNEMVFDDDCLLIDRDSFEDCGPSHKRQALGYTKPTNFDTSIDSLTFNSIRAALQSAYQHVCNASIDGSTVNFEKPLTDSHNSGVVASVIERVKTMLPKITLTDEQWQGIGLEFLRNCSKVKDKTQSDSSMAMLHPKIRKQIKQRRINRRNAKLQRRQKSYTELRKSLSSQEAAKFQYVLSRDVTSSDEEIEGSDCLTRVRILPWESAETTEMKRRLDETFFSRLASDKQITTYQRCLRDGVAVSMRAVPDGAPSWLYNQDFCRSTYFAGTLSGNISQSEGSRENELDDINRVDDFENIGDSCGNGVFLPVVMPPKSHSEANHSE